MMTTTLYRLLLTAATILGIFGASLDFAFPSLLPEAFHHAQQAYHAQQAQDDAAFPLPLVLLVTIGGIGIVLLIVSTYGLYRFRAWAPRLSIIATMVLLLATPFSGALVQSGIAVTICYLSSYLWGAALVLSFVPPLSAQFKRRGG